MFVPTLFFPKFLQEKTASLSAKFDVSSWNFQLAVSHIKAEGVQATPASGYQRPNVYYYDLGKNTHGIWSVPTSGFAEDMIYDGETAWMDGWQVWVMTFLHWEPKV